jgi:hypothetical protein
LVAGSPGYDEARLLEDWPGVMTASGGLAVQGFKLNRGKGRHGEKYHFVFSFDLCYIQDVDPQITLDME